MEELMRTGRAGEVVAGARSVEKATSLGLDSAADAILGGVDVTYVNPAKADAWDCDVTKLVLFADADDAEGTTVHGSKLTGKDAEDVRDLKYGAIEVHLD